MNLPDRLTYETVRVEGEDPYPLVTCRTEGCDWLLHCTWVDLGWDGEVDWDEVHPADHTPPEVGWHSHPETWPSVVSLPWTRCNCYRPVIAEIAEMVHLAPTAFPVAALNPLDLAQREHVVAALAAHWRARAESRVEDLPEGHVLALYTALLDALIEPPQTG